MTRFKVRSYLDFAFSRGSTHCGSLTCYQHVLLPDDIDAGVLAPGLTVKYVPIQTLYRSGQSKISLVTDGVRFL
jgi:hypothetical protein